MADKGAGVGVAFDGYLGNITSMELSVNSEEVDVTTLAVTGGGKLYERADLYSSELSVEGLFDPADSPHVIGNGTAGNCVITFSDAGTTTWSSSGFMRDLTVTASDVDDRVRFSATLRLSGNLTIA